MQRRPELHSLKPPEQGGDDDNAPAARAVFGLSGGSHSSISDHSYSTHSENQLANTFLSSVIPVLGFSLVWESAGNSHISKNFPIAFRNAACCIPPRNAFPSHSINKHRHGRDFLKPFAAALNGYSSTCLYF